MSNVQSEPKIERPRIIRQSHGITVTVLVPPHPVKRDEETADTV